MKEGEIGQIRKEGKGERGKYRGSGMERTSVSSYVMTECLVE